MQKRLATKIIDTYTPKNYKKHVALLMGGESNEREVSFSSGHGVLAALKKLGYKVTAIDMGYDVAKTLLDVNPDVVFIALHGTFGEDGCVQGMLEIMGIPYTHSGVLSASVGLNKEFSYNIIKAAGITVPKREIVDVEGNNHDSPLPKPYVIKPISEGSSIGVSVVLANDNYDLKAFIAENGTKFGNRIIVEEYIPGREIQVAIVNGKALGAIEIKTKRKFYDYIAKYTPGESEHIMPAPLSANKLKELLELTENIYSTLMCSGAARIDFRYDDRPEVDKFYFLEANTHPGFTPTSLVPEIAEYNNISYEQLVELLVEDAKCYSVITNI